MAQALPNIPLGRQNSVTGPFKELSDLVSAAAQRLPGSLVMQRSNSEVEKAMKVFQLTPEVTSYSLLGDRENSEVHSASKGIKMDF